MSRLNPHNQFLHSTVTLGIVGLLILVSIFTIPIAIGIKTKNYFFIFFIIAVVLNCMTESVLEVQKGILFFCVFSVLLFNSANGIQSENS